ncbi:M15 family metallopeptidase [Echinicola vietnamensis]|uniref:D-alanyl-D-alanine dipeptidase n=1 Tax=Echinicola vietnamensis (strain DSM 17526 / LMG 23754 / KMM 6221) TaxID=926556 RepID=L0FYH3_ECHVK|nr:M15 family metallopeptidase [Echinicola vietnamensis]AGA78078.1 D-alanyl-D-alanine dipeptidase [Echinicola vietnamensis DSM 17526]
MRHLLYLFILAMVMACNGRTGHQSESAADKSVTPSAIKDLDPTTAKEPVTAPKDSLGKLEKGLIVAGLVNVKAQLPEVFVELKYSTTDNFFGKDVYGPLVNCYLQPEVVKMLKEALTNLQKEHSDLTFLIYDGVRPRSVQQILWDDLDKPDSLKPLYVANPQKGSLHNYGVAVDLTLANRSTGKPLDMGTHYDYFGYPAYPDREEQMLAAGKITAQQVNNRKILRAAMNKAGFSEIGSEWWHFNAFSLQEAKSRYKIVE